MTEMSVELTMDHPNDLVVSSLARQQALHIVREALTNAWRHAAAQRVTVHVERAGESVCITVRDDGRGFEPSAVDASAHLGLTIMRARAERSGGALRVETQPGAGTTIVATFPLAKEQQHEPLAPAAG